MCVCILLTKQEVKMAEYWTKTSSRSIKTKKDFTLLRIKNDLFISGARKESQLCLWHNKPTRVIHDVFVLTVFCPFSSTSITEICKSPWRSVFLVWNLSGQSQGGSLDSQSQHRILFILPTGMASDSIW